MAQTGQLPRIQPRRANGAAASPRTASVGPESANRPGNTSEFGTTNEWFAIEHGEQPVGYERLVTNVIPELSDKVTPGTGAMLRRERESRLALKRSGRDLSVSAFLATQESPDGVLHKWTLRRTAGDGTLMIREGVWLAENQAYEVSEQVQATSRVRRVSAAKQPRSPVISGWIAAVARTSDRRFRLPVFFPESTSVVEMNFSSAGRQSIRMQDGKQITVDRIDYAPADDPSKKTSVFIDEAGQMIRSEQMLLGSQLALIRTDAATAVGSASMEALDLDLAGMIPVRPPILNPEQLRVLHLRISLAPSEFLSIPDSELQRVTRISGHQAIVTLTRADSRSVGDSGSGGVGSVPGERAVAAEYLARTRWIDPEDPEIQQLVRRVGTNRDAVEYCRSMTRHVSAQLNRSAFSTSLQPSSEVARTMSGDCTEAAVLLAAMMRAAAIPSRVAVGFVYVERTASFAGHMWTEAWINGHWIPFDAAAGPEGVGVTHLRIIESSLPDSITSGTLLFLPLLKFMGQAKIEESHEGAP